MNSCHLLKPKRKTTTKTKTKKHDFTEDYKREVFSRVIKLLYPLFSSFKYHLLSISNITNTVPGIGNPEKVIVLSLN